MRIQCDACEQAAASVICCADEAALCRDCDIKVHKANKLASKHKRLPLLGTSPKLSRCDICQDRAAIVFCLEDRAMLCQDCDESVHSRDTLAAKHQRFLATGIRVGLNAQSSESPGSNEFDKQPSSISNPTAPTHATPRMGSTHSSSAKSIPLGEPCWSMDELLPISDFESKGDPEGLGEFDWEVDGLDHLGLFEQQQEQEEALACRVPELCPTGPGGRPNFTVKGKSKAEIPTVPDFDEACIVPDIGSLDTHEFYPTPQLKRARRSSFEAW